MPPRLPQVGDHLEALTLLTNDSTPTRFSLTAGRLGPLVLVSFERSCNGCQRFKPILDSILGENSSLDFVILTADSPGVAREELPHNRNLRVFSIPTDLPPTSPERALTARTPWYYVVDTLGVVRATGVGGDLLNVLRSGGLYSSGSERSSDAA